MHGAPIYPPGHPWHALLIGWPHPVGFPFAPAPGPPAPGPPPKRRKYNPPYRARKHWGDLTTEIHPKVDIDTNTYFHWLPMDVKRLLFLYLPTLQAQRLSAGSSLCNGEFWSKKALAKGLTAECKSPEDYVKLVNDDEHVLAFCDITPGNKDRILDAIAIKDLPLFEYYANHTRFQREGHVGTIEWYAYFAGKEFYDVWIRATVKYLGYGTGATPFRLEMAAVRGDMEFFLSMRPVNYRGQQLYDPEIIPAVITGGNLDMLRYLLEDKIPNAAEHLPQYRHRPTLEEGEAWDWNIFRWIACAKLHGHEYIVTYLEPMIRNGKPNAPLPFPRFSTTPTKGKKGYQWKVRW